VSAIYADALVNIDGDADIGIGKSQIAVRDGRASTAETQAELNSKQVEIDS